MSIKFLSQNICIISKYHLYLHQKIKTTIKQYGHETLN
nr:MAG TPA: hypothetical protein [Caudoviricetes sp.]DAN34834.1 MAG TPA: hypothetical protein [Caudoviricetes sp.]DAU36338.1 MAG TPA: hypothetical protein [Caudoviricetes sp.]